jgi:hypothetical protein
VPGLLNGQLAKEVYAAFRGKLLKGTLWRAGSSESAGLDERGDERPGATPMTWPCQGFVEAYDDSFRARAGIPDTDSRVNIFSQSLPAGIQPGIDDKVLMPSPLNVPTWYQLRRVGTDPATALWVCQAHEVLAPPLT